MKWSMNELNYLSTILEQIASDLGPIDGKQILVLCSATGEVALRLAELMESGHVTGLELDFEALEVSRQSAHAMGLDSMADFLPAEKRHIPAPDASFDGLVSEFIVYPTTTPTEIGQVEMARLLRPGGRMILTDVIVTTPMSQEIRHELTSLGLDYLCEGTQTDFRAWMADAGLINVDVIDLTPTLRKLWDDKRQADKNPHHRQGYAYLLDDPLTSLGKSIFYIYVRGEKPKAPPLAHAK